MTHEAPEFVDRWRTNLTIGAPPADAGVPQLTVTRPEVGTARGAVGADGTVLGVAMTMLLEGL